MAARWISDPKVGGSNPSSFMPFFGRFGPLFKKKCAAETGNRTQAAAATTRSPATRLFRLNVWRIRVSIPVLNLAKVVCYHVQQSPKPTASIGTRTRILSLEGINTTLVLWTLRMFARSQWLLRARGRNCKREKKSGRGGLNSRPKDHCVRRCTLNSPLLYR